MRPRSVPGMNLDFVKLNLKSTFLKTLCVLNLMPGPRNDIEAILRQGGLGSTKVARLKTGPLPQTLDLIDAMISNLTTYDHGMDHPNWLYNEDQERARGVILSLVNVLEISDYGTMVLAL